jgi:acyl-CoA thioesterase FadM
MPPYRQRVEFGDCDPAQVAYYPNFFLWLDRSTHALFETAGVPMQGPGEIRSRLVQRWKGWDSAR